MDEKLALKVNLLADESTDDTVVPLVIPVPVIKYPELMSETEFKISVLVPDTPLGIADVVAAEDPVDVN